MIFLNFYFSEGSEMKPPRSVFHRCRRPIRSCRHNFVNRTSLLTDDFYHNLHFLSHQSAKKKLKMKRKIKLIYFWPLLLPHHDCADNNTQQLCLSWAKRVLQIICASDSFQFSLLWYCYYSNYLYACRHSVWNSHINDLLNLIDRSKNSSARISTLSIDLSDCFLFINWATDPN